MDNSIFELLAPAGSFETFKAVVNAGADAVYVGGDMFGARAYANNFTEEELIKAIKYAHLRNRKVYLTVNTLLKNDEIKNKLIEYIRPYYINGLDAVLIQDFGALKLLHETFPDLPLHTSTQMTVTSSYGVRFLQKYGVTRVVMAREMSISEMKRIHDETGIEIEAFVHGALCYSYSGQCLFSSILGGRSGNRGRCAQPCRLSYEVLNENRKKISDDTYILSLKDMCGLENLKELHDGGIYSLKIEGRMKQTSYAAGVVSYYRKYIDRYIKKHSAVSLSPSDKDDIFSLGNRCGFTCDYYIRHNSSDMVTYTKPNYSTANEALHQSIIDKYASKDNKLKITGNAFFYQGSPCILSVYYNNYCATAEGNIVTAAKNAPATSEQIKSRLCKTGDTDFEFTSLDIELDDNIFIPNGELNKLRRKALEELSEQILAESYRDCESIDVDAAKSIIENSTNISSVYDSNKSILNVSIENRNLLDLCIAREIIDNIYIDYDSYTRENFAKDAPKDISKIKANNKSVYLILPSIMRADTIDFFNKQEIIDALSHYDGFIIKNYEEIQYIKDNFNKSLRDYEMILDYNMYTFNNIARQAFADNGLCIDTIPIELNSREISKRANQNSEMIIYGHYVLMTTAGCVHKNIDKCDKCRQITYLKDRYNKVFPVKNKCNECYNMIYNSVPTMLFANINKLKACNINRFRLNFTIENTNTAAKILDLYEDYRPDGVDFEYTNGHFKRGVE